MPTPTLGWGRTAMVAAKSTPTPTLELARTGAIAGELIPTATLGLGIDTRLPLPSRLQLQRWGWSWVGNIWFQAAGVAGVRSGGVAVSRPCVPRCSSSPGV